MHLPASCIWVRKKTALIHFSTNPQVYKSSVIVGPGLIKDNDTTNPNLGKKATKWATLRCVPSIKYSHLSDIKRFHCEDVHAARLKVVPQVVGGDQKHHRTGVAFLSIELDKHVGVWAAASEATRLHRDVVVNVWHTQRHKQERHGEFTLKRWKWNSRFPKLTVKSLSIWERH